MSQLFTRRTMIQAALAGGGLLAGLPARADTPSAGRALFGFPLGSVSATVGNTVLKAMHGHYEPDLGTELVSVTGGAGLRSIETCRKGPADGSVVLYNASSILSLLPNVRKVQAAEEIIPVTPVAEFTLAFAVGPAVPREIVSMNDYVAWVRKNPEQGACGLPGMGTSHHFVGLSIARTTGLPLQPVAYQGLVPMTRDLLEGHLPAAVVILGSAHEAHRAGTLRLLAVTSRSRWPALPDVPSLRELGLSTVDVAHTFGFHLPAGTPASKVQELNEAVKLAVGSPEMMELMARLRMRSAHSSPAEYAAVITAERAAWKAVVEKERFTIDG